MHMQMGGESWLTALNCGGRRGALLLGALVLLLLPALGGPEWLHALRYERVGLQHGEYWRLFTAHFVHLGWQHLLLDAAGLLLLWILYARDLNPGTWLLALASAMAAVDAGLWWLAPQVAWYAGISGLLHGAWAAGAVAGARLRQPVGWLLLGALAAKLAWEQHQRASLLITSFPVVVDVHLYGALGATAAMLALVIARKPL